MTTPEDLAGQLLGALDERLAPVDAELAADYPGDRPGRQPVHTVYVPADRYRADLVPAYGAAALALIDEHPDRFRRIVGTGDLVARVRAKLAAEPVEDLRIDFEDGYVGHTDADEDADVARAAGALAKSQRTGSAAPYGGIRVKCFEAATRSRSARTLTTFVATLLDDGGSLEGWVVTLPKVTRVEQVEAMVEACGTLEEGLGLPGGALAFEVQIETPQSILGADGAATVARIIHAGGDRLTGLHYGTYDYSAAAGIAAEQQSLEHPVADHAKLVMQAAAAGTGVRLSDGSTNVLPVGSADEIDAAWALHHRLVTRSLERGLYQGWDLHPGQLPTRYAATFAFYRGGLARALTRLSDYTQQQMGGIADEPATARALAGYLLRGVQSGAVDATEVEAGAGLDLEQLTALASPRRS
ncbi:aldolase [Nocardioides humilatus]|uniref:Aldolase n=1 Tax=Nocardioides humilatus TaxID=2607660 RepID=A0A5B1LHA7_9ACTN|nr:aldolase/citrate lyase family protein [Nocardioides humilatus]KAA1419007.1 aldolase [Nocardioides humilatus]